MHALPVVITALSPAQFEGVVAQVRDDERCLSFHRLGFNSEGDRLLVTADLSDEASAGVAIAIMANICEVNGIGLRIDGLDIEGDMYADEDAESVDWLALLVSRQ